MTRKSGVAILLGAGLFLAATVSLALDPPHDGSSAMGCDSCHILHNSLGSSLTSDTNANLCLSCHTVGGPAGALPLSSSMEAYSSASGWVGTSHRWDGTMPATDAPTNRFGLRSVASLADPNIAVRVKEYGNVVTCSACHDQHSQNAAPWDPFAGGGTATSGTASVVKDNRQGWTPNQWAGNYVKMTGGANLNQVAQIAFNTYSSLTLVTPFTAPVAAGDPYIIARGRHFQRSANSLNQACEDCHYYRSPASGQTDVETWTGKPLSHPVGKVFTSANGETPNVADPSQFNSAPLKPAFDNWSAQTGGRYQYNRGSDTNSTNNLVVDPTGQVRCLSCHGIHYTDSDSGTVDQP